MENFTFWINKLHIPGVCISFWSHDMTQLGVICELFKDRYVTCCNVVTINENYKQRGPSTLPWGTPERTWIHSENSPLNITCCFISLIQLLIHNPLMIIIIILLLGLFMKLSLNQWMPRQNAKKLQYNSRERQVNKYIIFQGCIILGWR